ncbi:MAG: TetR/AcrR family transcriptional regulator [Thermodesulfobacteriota bacterium]|jgi:AcrR family transcriptional regulator
MARPAKTPSSPDLRAAIAAQAEALFAERGFDGACIREIAQRAGATTGLIYHYYGSKEDLYLTLMETAVRDHTIQIEEIAASQDTPPDKVRRVVRVFLDSYRARPQHFQLVHRAIDECHPAVLALAERWFSRVYRALQTIAEEGMRKAVFKPLPSHLVPFIIISLIVHALRCGKLQDRITPGFSAADLFASLEGLVLTLLTTPQAQKKRYARRQPEKRPRSLSPRPS